MKANLKTGGALGLVAAAVMLALTGCGDAGMSGSSTTAAPAITTEPPASAQPTTAAPPASAPAASPAAAPAQILIKGFQYQGTLTVSPGAEITVTNEDIEAHTVTADDGTAFDAMAQVGTATFTAPTEPGTYPFHCIFHGNMRGTLTVK